MRLHREQRTGERSDSHSETENFLKAAGDLAALLEVKREVVVSALAEIVRRQAALQRLRDVACISVGNR